MKRWRWISTDLVYAVHEVQLARHGGLDGLRDQNAVESALARPEQLHVYGNPAPDAADLAAAYAYGLARNHGFSDGNKRTAWVVARVFLADNDVRLQFSEIDAIHAMQAVAGGALDEQQLADWFRQRIVKPDIA
ncbi:MAG: type II toxin-antitoxin system death-on-curing family toxin [Burkholderiaceae bacterium]